MGTSGSYGGSGGKQAKDLRRDLNDWLDSLPPTPPSQDPSPDEGDDSPRIQQLQPETVLNVVPMFRPRTSGSGGGDGPGGMGGGSGGGAAIGNSSGGRRRGGAQRSAARFAGTAGRAAAAALAYRTGNAEALRELGLDYDDLRGNPDPIYVTRKIVEAACGPLSDGTIEDEERRKVAAEIAAWVLEEQGEAPPTPEEIVREAIARIIFEAATTESAQLLRDGKRPEWATEEGERQIHECAEALAARAELSATGPTAVEFEKAIEDGIETLRKMFWGGS